MTIEDLLTDTERRRLEAQRLLGLAEALLTHECERAARAHVQNALFEVEQLQNAGSGTRHHCHSRPASIDTRVG